VNPLAMDSLLDTLRPLRWFGDKNAISTEFRCIDWALVDVQQDWHCLWVLLQHCSSDRRYSFLIRRNCRTDIYEDATYGRELIDVLFADPSVSLHTQAGAYLSFNAQENLTNPYALVPLEKDITTNTLFKLTTVAGDWAVKFYRTLTLNNEHEVSVLKVLSTQSPSYTVAGTIEYHLPAGDKPVSYTLAVVNKFIDGLPAYKFYSISIKALFSCIAKGDMQQLSSMGNVEDLYPLSFTIGTQIAFFHKKINDYYVRDGEHSFNLQDYIQCNRNRWQRVYEAVLQDKQLDAEDSTSLCAYLQQGYAHCLTDSFVQRHASFPASIFHGDLHLSHIFVDPNDIAHCLLIDPSPRSLDEHDKEFSTQSALQDLENLHRGLDYFSYDEIVDDLAITMNVSQLAAAKQLWQQPEAIARDYPAHYYWLCHWSDTVFSGLLDGYVAQRIHVDSMQRSVMQLFYFCRLLKEMEYNYTFDRPLFKYCDYFYLRKFVESLAADGEPISVSTDSYTMTSEEV
jgi:hypothetical protein